jgi:UDP-N-acetylglucosamine--N-acetylmuramyl-(pentapeptide) pyrophosphoryl-undecaprenol N-acetylglucosamine transferase
MKNIILTGGGTAGHVTPNIALIPMLRDAGYRIHYIGSKDGIEKTLIAQNKTVTYHEIPSGKLRRYFSFQNFIDPFKIIAGIFKYISLVKKINTSVCF